MGLEEILDDDIIYSRINVDMLFSFHNQIRVENKFLRDSESEFQFLYPLGFGQLYKYDAEYHSFNSNNKTYAYDERMPREDESSDDEY